MQALLSIAYLISAASICMASLCPNGYAVVEVTKSASSHSCDTNGVGPVQCKYLSDALALKNLDNSCILIYDDQLLNGNYTLMDKSNLVLSGTKQNIYITCNVTESNIYEKDVGLSWKNSRNIFVTNLDFIGCGVKHSYSTKLTENYINTQYLTTGVYLKNVTNVTFENVTLDKSLGYGLTIFDAPGNVIFKSVTARNNIKIPNYSQKKTYAGYASGGGIFIAYRESNLTSSNNVIQFINCSFTFNEAEESLNDEVESLIHRGYLIPFGRGGGVTIFFKESIQNHVIYFNTTLFDSNRALWGGGVYVRVADTGSRLYFNACVFGGNNAVYAGGGVLIFDSLPSNIPSGDYVEIFACFFERNNATIGGGYAYEQQKGVLNRNKNGTQIIESRFSSNSAILGCAIYVSWTHLTFLNSDIMSNSYFNNEKVSQGAVVMYKSSVYVFGQNTVSQNENTAFVFDSTYIKLFGTLKFIKNMGQDGGAISMFGHSKIILSTNSSILFKENVAEKRGGAMFVLVPGPPLPYLDSIQLNRYDCFFKLPSYGTVRFNSNNASSNIGTSIYASTLQNCLTKDDTSFNDVFTGNGTWNNFTFIDKITNATISTATAAIHINPDDWNNVPPGVYSQRDLILNDERGNKVNDAVDINVYQYEEKSNVNVEGNYKEFMITNGRVDMALLGNIKDIFNVTIISPDSGALVTLENLSLGNCSFGYTYNSTQRKCNCMAKKKYHNGIAQCLGNKVYLFKNRWAKPFQHNRDDETSQVCPEDYCAKCRGSFADVECLYVPEEQCNNNRIQSSYLCSKCAPNLSVLLTGGVCKECWGTYNWILMTFIHFVCTFFVTLVIVYLNSELYASYLNPVIYSYQMIILILPSDFELDFFIRTVLIIVSGSLNHSMYEFCFYNGLDDLTKYLVYYCAPFAWIVSWMIICFILARVTCFQRYLNRDACLKSINTLFLICCCSFFKFSFSVLKSVEIDGELRVYVYAAAKYGSSKHLPFLLTAALTLTLMLVCIAVIFVSTCRRSSNTRFDAIGCCLWMKPVLYSFRYGFRSNQHSRFKDRTWFAPFYVLCSFILIAVSILNDHDDKHTWQGLCCLLFMTFFIAASPYNEGYMNYFDIAMLTNLTFLAAVIDGLPSNQYKFGVKISVYIPLVSLLIRLGYHIFIMQDLFQYFPRRFRNPTERHHVPIPQVLMNDDRPHVL